MFRTCGYPEPVAHLLTGLVTNAAPVRVRAAAPPPRQEGVAAWRRQLAHLGHPHLPQGAPTSPALANLAAYRLDCRLAGLAEATQFAYTRYADDLAFSARRARSAGAVDAFIRLVGEIVASEGFRLNQGKTTVRRPNQRQRLAGIVINEHPNVLRTEYDLLKATLHRFSQLAEGAPVERREELRGRIAWVGHLNPGRGERLLATFDDIAWA